MDFEIVILTLYIHNYCLAMAEQCVGLWATRKTHTSGMHQLIQKHINHTITYDHTIIDFIKETHFITYCNVCH